MAGNELRGRVEVRDRTGKTYTLHYGFAAIRAIEQIFGVSGWKELGEKVDSAIATWSQEQTVAVLRAGLRRFHPEVADDEQAIDDLAFESTVGLVQPCLDAIVAGGKQILNGEQLQQKPPGVGQDPPPKTAAARAGKSS